MIIPTVLTKKISKDFHSGYPEMSRMKALMRSYVYWLGMDKDIENIVAKAPPIKFNSWPETDKQWSRLHIGNAGSIKRTYIFVIVDSFTKWPEVFIALQ